MQKNLLLVIITLAFGFAAPCYGQEWSVHTTGDLVENGKAMDGARVAMTVEMIGDIMNRGSFTWVNGLDSTGAMGFWVPTELASGIKMLGNGKQKGDTAEIRGVFHRACPEHGGDMDIHVSSMNIIRPGYPLENRIPRDKIFASVLLTVAALGMVGFYRKYRLA